ncbi:MAG: P-loop NTPase [Aeriscardovia sp.]|nr:P-loop NTPase [Aeriscardovia sp.]MBQ1298865.1 P-loop NTPase [Aeriscardovia sp.]
MGKWIKTRPKGEGESAQEACRPTSDKDELKIEREAFEKIKGIISPRLGIEISHFDMISSISAVKRRSLLSKETTYEVNVDIEIPEGSAGPEGELEGEIAAALETIGSSFLKIIPSVKLHPMEKSKLDVLMSKHVFSPQNPSIPILVVASGKGGVGKSSIAVNLAATYAAMGKKPGLIDADVYGYSLSSMLGIKERPNTVDSMLIPASAWGIKAVSLGMFAPDNKPILWRGPRLSRAFSQFINKTLWDDIGILIVDLPPGTGDMMISCAQMLPTSSCLLVTTPQISASLVASRSAVAFAKFNEKILGVVENMAFSEEGGKNAFPFGRGGGEKAVEILSEASGRHIPLLAKIPLDSDISMLCDEGRPAVLNEDGSLRSTRLARLFSSLAEKIENLVKADEIL